MAYVRNHKHRGQSVAQYRGWNGFGLILERLSGFRAQTLGQRHDTRCGPCADGTHQNLGQNPSLTRRINEYQRAA